MFRAMYYYTCLIKCKDNTDITFSYGDTDIHLYFHVACSHFVPKNILGGKLLHVPWDACFFSLHYDFLV